MFGPRVQRGRDGRALWQSDATAVTCAQCDAEFGWFRRRHHCRHCGGIVCDECSRHRAVAQGYAEEVRVCTSCFQLLGNTALDAAIGDDDDDGVGGGGADAVPFTPYQPTATRRYQEARRRERDRAPRSRKKKKRPASSSRGLLSIERLTKVAEGVSSVLVGTLNLAHAEKPPPAAAGDAQAGAGGAAPVPFAWPESGEASVYQATFNYLLNNTRGATVLASLDMYRAFRLSWRPAVQEQQEQQEEEQEDGKNTDDNDDEVMVITRSAGENIDSVSGASEPRADVERVEFAVEKATGRFLRVCSDLSGQVERAVTALLERLGDEPDEARLEAMTAVVRRATCAAVERDVRQFWQMCVEAWTGPDAAGATEVVSETERRRVVLQQAKPLKNEVESIIAESTTAAIECSRVSASHSLSVLLDAATHTPVVVRDDTTLRIALESGDLTAPLLSRTFSLAAFSFDGATAVAWPGLLEAYRAECDAAFEAHLEQAKL